MVQTKLKTIQIKLSVPKSQYNSFGKFYYRSLEDILNAVKPLLDDLDLVLVLRDEMVLIGDRYYIKAIAELTDLEDGSVITGVAWAREPLEKKGNDESQITGAASTYARKYALNGLFALDDTRDPDSMDNSVKEPQSAPKQQQNQPRQQETRQQPPKQQQQQAKQQTKQQAAPTHITKDQADLIRDSIRKYECVGVTEANLLRGYHVSRIEDMTPDMYKDCMRVFEIKYEPKYQDLYMIPDGAPDGGLPWN